MGFFTGQLAAGVGGKKKVASFSDCRRNLPIGFEHTPFAVDLTTPPTGAGGFAELEDVLLALLTETLSLLFSFGALGPVGLVKATLFRFSRLSLFKSCPTLVFSRISSVSGEFTLNLRCDNSSISLSDFPDCGLVTEDWLYLVSMPLAAGVAVLESLPVSGSLSLYNRAGFFCFLAGSSPRTLRGNFFTAAGNI